MSAAQIYILKQAAKAFGVDAEALELKLKEGQKVVLEFDLNELRTALQTLLDYRENQAQNELRLMAIINHLGIVDPVILSQLQLKDDHNG